MALHRYFSQFLSYLFQALILIHRRTPLVQGGQRLGASV